MLDCNANKMMDINKIPVPKYKVEDKVWIVDYSSIKQIQISCVIIKGMWFDNGYTSRHEFKVTYESCYGLTHSEDQFYNSKRTAQRRLAEYKIKERSDRIDTLRRDINNIQIRCKNLGLTIDDL